MPRGVASTSYHPRFREQQEAAKHEHVLEVAPALPRLRKHTAEDLKARGLCRGRVLACAARLLDLGFFRIGNESYRRDNETHGLTTLLREHASCHHGEVRFAYPAKEREGRVAGAGRGVRVPGPARAAAPP